MVTWRLLRVLMPRTRGSFLAAAGVAAWVSVVAASAACAVEIAFWSASAERLPLGVVLPAMVGIHALIGLGEAFITTAAISVILATRPDIVRGFQPVHERAGG